MQTVKETQESDRRRWIQTLKCLKCDMEIERDTGRERMRERARKRERESQRKSERERERSSIAK